MTSESIKYKPRTNDISNYLSVSLLSSLFTLEILFLYISIGGLCNKRAAETRVMAALKLSGDKMAGVSRVFKMSAGSSDSIASTSPLSIDRESEDV